VKSIVDAAQLVLSTVLRDEPWQDLGFTKRPKYGEIVQRFRPQWRVQLERAILKQMVAILSAVHVQAGILEDGDLPQLLEIYVDGPDGTQDLWRSYGYTSRAEAVEDLSSAIGEYVKSDPEQWTAVLGSKLDVPGLPDKKLAANLFVGVIRFAQTAQGMMLYLRSHKAV